MKTFSQVVTAALLLIAQSNSTGVVYTARFDKLGKKSAFNVWATDAKAKFLVTESDDPSMPMGISIIALDGGGRYDLIFPEKQAFVEMTRDQFRKLRQQQAEAHGVKIENSKLEELVVDGDGGLVAGNKTRYFKLKIAIDAIQNGQHIEFRVTEEFWTAPSIPNPAPSLDMLTQQVSGLDQIDSLLDYKKLNGYPLKRVVQLCENDQFIGTSTVEITSIVNTSIAESLFTPPSDYKKIEVPADRLQ